MGGEQSDGRAVLAEGGTTVGEPPAVMIPDDIGSPHMMGKAGNGVVRPLGNDGHDGLGLDDPGLTVFGGHLLDTHACAEEVIGITFLGHDGVVDHWGKGLRVDGGAHQERRHQDIKPFHTTRKLCGCHRP